ncbi:RNA polymerase sigma factor [Eubacterium limosum]|uniref:RNA polymerase sigma factor n=1 Tax=Eubacterium limosum TaxID=1736 RepID=UPI001063DE1C|nr:sigma factor-like helix-turn-helix DNA-binding protein [Eubacterium limosum]
MTTINLRDFFYWYITDEPLEVSDEVAAVLRSDKRYEERHYERRKRNKAQYSLDAGDGIENHIVELEPSAQEILERKERFCHLCRALNSLPEAQGRRIDAHLILGKSVREIADDEGVSVRAVQIAIRQGLDNMKKNFKNF